MLICPHRETAPAANIKNKPLTATPLTLAQQTDTGSSSLPKALGARVSAPFSHSQPPPSLPRGMSPSKKAQMEPQASVINTSNVSPFPKQVCSHDNGAFV
jgi:hypothetical protein